MTTGEQRLEALLRSAASDDAAWPATPDLRAGVMARIEATQPAGASAGPAPAGRPMAGEAARSRPAAGPEPVGRPVAGEPTRARPRSRLRIGTALAFALVALLVLAGIAAALGLGLPGVTIDQQAFWDAAGRDASGRKK